MVGDLGLTGLQGVSWWLCPVLIWNGVIDRHFCWDIMKQGKKVLALGSMACIMDFRVFHGNLCHSYQERALPTELCGRVALILEGVGFEPT